MSTQHLKWVDISKGIVICLMVLGHSGIPKLLSGWIWSFHMPFFFIISAMWTSWDRIPFGAFIKRRAKILFIPFIIYSLINLALYPIIFNEPFLTYANRVLQEGWGGVALWFVPVFFISLVITKSIPRAVLLPASIVLILIGVLLCKENIDLPWTMSAVPFAAGIMLIVRRYSELLKELSQKSDWVLAAISIVGGGIALIVSLFWRLDMASNTITPLLPILLGIAGGCSCVTGLSIILSRYSVLTGGLFTHIGRNTFEIMALSQVTIASVNYFIPMPAVFKYMILVALLTGTVYLRKAIEGKYSKVEAI